MAKSEKKEIDEYLQEAHDETTGVVGATKKADKVDEDLMEEHDKATRMKKGGCVKMASGGTVSARADGVCVKGKTRGRMV
jgi:hypothetical protein